MHPGGNVVPQGLQRVVGGDLLAQLLKDGEVGRRQCQSYHWQLIVATGKGICHDIAVARFVLYAKIIPWKFVDTMMLRPVRAQLDRIRTLPAWRDGW